MDYITVHLEKSFKKSEFKCGKPSLDDYLHKIAKQDAQKNIARTFVYAEGSLIKGYYSISSNSIPRDYLPEQYLNKLPLYSTLPTTILGRLAVDERYQHQGLGSLLLFDVFKRCYMANQIIASHALVVDAIDDRAKEFYQKYEFIPLDSMKLFLPMRSIIDFVQEEIL